jgi:acetyl esterase/lipase
VLINFNGGAFVFPAHGADERFCRHVVTRTSFTVLDAAYALAPEYPFPAALDDAASILTHVRVQPETYDAQSIVLCGFSSGGNIALSTAASAGQRVRGVVAFYPPADMTVAPTDKRAPGDDGGPRPEPPALMKAVMGAFRAAYLPPGVDPADPRVSVGRAEPEGFPENVLIITTEKDRLALEAEALGGRLKGAGKTVVTKRFDRVGHGWDKAVEDGSEEARVRDEAYDLVVKLLEDLQ